MKFKKWVAPNFSVGSVKYKIGSAYDKVPAQDLMVWILRSKTRMLARWVMSPANLNMFILSDLDLLLLEDNSNRRSTRYFLDLFDQLLRSKSPSSKFSKY